MSVRMITLKSREDWLERRTSYIGGSDAAACIGKSPYKSNVELWEEKTGRRQQADISGKDCVEYGKSAEYYLRELFKLDFPEYKVEYIENNMWLNDTYPWAHASLDGWLRDDRGRWGILEIKTSEIMRASQRESWDEQIPDTYYLQILHYLAVTGFDFVVVKAQLKSRYGNNELRLTTKHYTIERAEVEDDIAYLMDKEAEFVEYIKADKRPPLILPEI